MSYLFLEINTSSIPFAGDGVFTHIPLQVGVLFGPYVGAKIAPGVDKKAVDTSYMWEVCMQLLWVLINLQMFKLMNII